MPEINLYFRWKFKLKLKVSITDTFWRKHMFMLVIFFGSKLLIAAISY